MNDQEIISLLEQGDHSALKTLMVKYVGISAWAGKTFHFSSEILHDHFVDAVIDLYEKVKKQEFVYKDANSVKNFLMTALRNKLINRLKMTKNRERLQSNVEEASKEWLFSENREDPLQEKKQLVKSCLKEMSPRCQKVLRMFYYEGMSLKEIAEQLAYNNEGTAKSTKHQCFKKLQELVRARGEKR